MTTVTYKNTENSDEVEITIKKLKKDSYKVTAVVFDKEHIDEINRINNRINE